MRQQKFVENVQHKMVTRNSTNYEVDNVSGVETKRLKGSINEDLMQLQGYVTVKK